jgi:hypothetical protein
MSELCSGVVKYLVIHESKLSFLVGSLSLSDLFLLVLSPNVWSFFFDYTVQRRRSTYTHTHPYEYT